MESLENFTKVPSKLEKLVLFGVFVVLSQSEPFVYTKTAFMS